MFKVSTISCLEENLTLTVSDGSSSVYKRLPDPLGFLPVPFLGSASFNSCLSKNAEGKTYLFNLSKLNNIVNSDPPGKANKPT